MLLASNELLRQEVIRLSDVLETLVASEKQENDKVQDAFANLFYMPEEIEGGGFGKLPRRRASYAPNSCAKDTGKWQAR
jgi:hypothetical protein